MSAPQMDCCLVRGSARQLRSWDFDFLLRWLVKTFEREEIQEKMREVLFPLLALPSSLPPLLPLPCGQWHSIFYLFHQQRFAILKRAILGIHLWQSVPVLSGWTTCSWAFQAAVGGARGSVTVRGADLHQCMVWAGSLSWGCLFSPAGL